MAEYRIGSTVKVNGHSAEYLGKAGSGMHSVFMISGPKAGSHQRVRDSEIKKS
jgi:hypothetical protein